MNNLFPMNIYIKIAALVLATTVISCEKPVIENPELEDPELEIEKPGSEKPGLEANTYSLDKEPGTFNSVFASNLGEYICIAATPSPGVKDFNEVFNQEEYFYVAISPLLNGKKFEMIYEKELYTVMSSLQGAHLESVTPTTLEEIQSGVCTLTCKDGFVEADVKIFLENESVLTVKLSTEDPGVVVNQNIFSLDGNDKPIRAAFSRQYEGTTEIYLTPAGIDYFDELPISTYYAYIILETSKCHGKGLTVDDVIAVGYADNFYGLIIDSRDVSATGSINVSAESDDPRHYIVSADLNIDGTSLKLRYDGKTLDGDKKEVIENKLIYMGENLSIEDVCIGPMPDAEDVYRVMITTSNDDIIYISLPVKFLDGNAHGFSQSPQLYIEYRGEVYSKANGSSGTVTIGIDDDMIKLEATNYNNLEISYVGAFKNEIFS